MTHRPSALRITRTVNMLKEPVIGLDLSGDSYTCIHTKAGARSLARFLRGVASRVEKEWVPQLGGK